MLPREVSNRRRPSGRLTLWLSLIGAGGGGAALVIALATLERPAPRVEVHAPQPVVYYTPPEPELEAPEDPPAERPMTRTCAVDLAVVGVPLAAVDEMPWTASLRGVATAGCVIATWSDDTVYVSRDDGVTFVPAVERGAEVADVHVADDGTVYVVRDDGTLGVQDADGTENIRALPIGLEHLATAGRYLVAMATHTVAVSTDRGVSWRFLALPVSESWSDMAADVRVERDGRLLVVAIVEDATVVLAGHVDGRPWREVDRWEESGENVLRDDGSVLSYVPGTPERFELRRRGEAPRALELWPATLDRAGNPLAIDPYSGLTRWTGRGGVRVLLYARDVEAYE